MWRENARLLHARERGVVPEGRWPSEDDEDLYLVQADENAELHIPESCSRPGLLPRRGVWQSRRRHHVPRPAPRFREARQSRTSSGMMNAFYPVVTADVEEDEMMDPVESADDVGGGGVSAGDVVGPVHAPVFGAGVGLSEEEASSESSEPVEWESETEAPGHHSDHS